MQVTVYPLGNSPLYVVRETWLVHRRRVLIAAVDRTLISRLSSLQSEQFTNWPITVPNNKWSHLHLLDCKVSLRHYRKHKRVATNYRPHQKRTAEGCMTQQSVRVGKEETQTQETGTIAQKN
jgi:hypothetical protein